MKKSEVTVTYLQKKCYCDHYAFVRSVVPAYKLLVYNVKEGWAPQHEFLDRETPFCPFPRENVNSNRPSPPSQYDVQVGENQRRYD